MVELVLWRHFFDTLAHPGCNRLPIGTSGAPPSAVGTLSSLTSLWLALRAAFAVNIGNPADVSALAWEMREKYPALESFLCCAGEWRAKCRSLESCRRCAGKGERNAAGWSPSPACGGRCRRRMGAARRRRTLLGTEYPCASAGEFKLDLAEAMGPAPRASAKIGLHGTFQSRANALVPDLAEMTMLAIVPITENRPRMTRSQCESPAAQTGVNTV
jgi:hypothetical protein